MNYMYLILFFLLGIILGEVYNFIGIRLSDDDEKLLSRSHCDKCYHKLTILEVIPIFSYIFLGGKCKYCHRKIDIKHPLIELLTGILFVFTYYLFGISYELLIALGIISLFVIICVSDLTYLIIPDQVIIFFGIYFIIIQFIQLGLFGTLEHVFTGLFLFCLMYIIMILGAKAFQKESLGGGYVKLMFIFGLILDPLLGTFAIFISSLIALPISLILLKKGKGHVIPFGPFLVLALILVYYIGLTPQALLNIFSF